MNLSVITTMYRSEPYIEEFYSRMTMAARMLTEDYEIIFVNDGSPDDSLARALRLFSKDPKVKVVDFSRNFGHHKAMMTGLSYAQGDLVFLIDVDLEERPELLGEFWQEMQASKDLDVVYGIQQNRKGNWFEKLSGAMFYQLFNYFSGTTLPRNLITARLMKKGYVDALVRFREQEIFLAGLWAITGFNQKGMNVEKLSHSPTTYSVGKKTAVLVNSITSFTNKPLLFIFYLGTFMSFFSFLYIGYLIFIKLSSGVLAGWTSLVASIWMVGGMVIFSIGILGIYLSKIFTEVKNRPYSIVKKYYSRDE